MAQIIYTDFPDTEYVHGFQEGIGAPNPNIIPSWVYLLDLELKT
jgi:hypothetical protein